MGFLSQAFGGQPGVTSGIPQGMAANTASQLFSGAQSPYPGKPNISTLPGQPIPGQKPTASTLPGQPVEQWGATLHPEPYAMELAMQKMQGIAPMLGIFNDGMHDRIEQRKTQWAANRKARAQPGMAPQANFLGQLGQL